MPNKANNTRQNPRKKITYIPAPLPAEGVVREPSVLAVLSISRSAWHDGIKAGKYPPGKLLSPRCRVWPVTQIRALLAELEAMDENHPQAKQNDKQ